MPSSVGTGFRVSVTLSEPHTYELLRDFSFRKEAERIQL